MLPIEISYIIPFYNGENTLIRCLDSIYAIGLDSHQFEVIIIDDNSPIKAENVLYDYMTTHHNIRIIRHVVNKRQGGAKNTGIRAAQGKYIAFADQDDKVVSTNVLEALHQANRNNVDMLACHYYVEREDGSMHEYGIQTGDGLCLSGKEFCEKHFVTSFNLAPWANLYRREFLLDVQHPYEENVVMEDADWIAWHWIHAEKVGVWNKAIYTWVMNPSSITHSTHYVNRADWIKYGYRKMRDAKIYTNLSPSFSFVMYNDGKHNISGGFERLWKVDSYSMFYQHIGKDILHNLQELDWKQPVRYLIRHPKISCAILNILGPVLKIANKIRYNINNYGN